MTTRHDHHRRQQRRRRTSFLFFALLAIAGSNGIPGASSFGVPTGVAAAAASRTASTPSSWWSSMLSDSSPSMPGRRSLSMKQPQNGNGSYRNQRTPKTSSDLIARKAALVDTSPPRSTSRSTRVVVGNNSNISSNSNNNNNNSNESEGIRSRVNSFLRSKKRKSSGVVEEVKDIDAIKSLLGETRKQAVYTAVIFHAPYCRACKASLPLFEELAKQYNKKNKLYDDNKSRQHKQPVVKFLSVPVTQDNSKDLQDQFKVTRFPLAHIYDPFDGLVDERPVLRKLFSGFEERLESVVGAGDGTAVPAIE